MVFFSNKMSSLLSTHSFIKHSCLMPWERSWWQWRFKNWACALEAWPDLQFAFSPMTDSKLSLDIWLVWASCCGCSGQCVSPRLYCTPQGWAPWVSSKATSWRPAPRQESPQHHHWPLTHIQQRTLFWLIYFRMLSSVSSPFHVTGAGRECHALLKVLFLPSWKSRETQQHIWEEFCTVKGFLKICKQTTLWSLKASGDNWNPVPQRDTRLYPIFYHKYFHVYSLWRNLSPERVTVQCPEGGCLRPCCSELSSANRMEWRCWPVQEGGDTTRPWASQGFRQEAQSQLGLQAGGDISSLHFGKADSQQRHFHGPFSWTSIHPVLKNLQGLPWWLSGKESACQCRRHGFTPWSGKIPHDSEPFGGTLGGPGERILGSEVGTGQGEAHRAQQRQGSLRDSRWAEHFGWVWGCLHPVRAVELRAWGQHCVCFASSLIISAVEHPFMFPLATCMPSLEKCLFRSSAYFYWVFLA